LGQKHQIEGEQQSQVIVHPTHFLLEKNYHEDTFFVGEGVFFFKGQICQFDACPTQS